MFETAICSIYEYWFKYVWIIKIKAFVVVKLLTCIVYVCVCKFFMYIFINNVIFTYNSHSLKIH